MRSVGLVAAGGVMLATVIAAAAVLAPQFRVDEIRVSGGSEPVRAVVQTLAWEIIRAESFFAGKARLLLIRPDRLAAELQRRVPTLLTAKVSRSLPRAVAIIIQDKVPLGFLATPQGLFAVDSEGAIIRPVSPADVASAGLPVVYLGHYSDKIDIGAVVVERDVLERLHDVVVLLPERLGVSVVDLTLPAAGSEEVHVRTDRGELLLFDTRRPLADQLRILEHALAEEVPPADVDRLEYVDLRVPGKVFYRVRRKGEG